MITEQNLKSLLLRHRGMSLTSINKETFMLTMILLLTFTVSLFSERKATAKIISGEVLLNCCTVTFGYYNVIIMLL